MTFPFDDSPFDRLGGAVAALEQGDWRAAWADLAGVDLAGGRKEFVDLQVCLRCVARSMRLQCVLGDVQAALHQLETAARLLPEGCSGRAPARARRSARITWATGRLVARERADLDAVRVIFGRIRRGRDELVYACVEHLTWVEFDPWTVQVHQEDRTLLGIGGDAYERFRSGNRRDICARATHLRQFADARGGTVNEKTWQRMGGYPGVRAEALRVLAAEPVTRGLRRVPVRFGRLRAWQYACRWVSDTRSRLT